MLALLLLVLLAAPIPYVRYEPGATYDTFGSVDGTRLVTVAKDAQHPQYKTTGELRMLTVYEWGGPLGPYTVADALRSLFDHAITLEPVEFVYPTDVSSDDVAEEGRTAFASAQNQAIAAALQELDIEVTPFVDIMTVDPKGPAAKFLKDGDSIVSMQGLPVSDITSLDAVLSTLKPGDELTIEVTRKGKLRELKFPLGKNDEGKARIGIFLLQNYKGPMDIKMQLDNVGGPSAGLAFALTIYDKLSPGDLLRGRVIAVTGTIEADGRVGAIGGLHQKFAAAYRAGARTMLIPWDNCRSIENDIPEGLTVVPVRTLHQAVSLLSRPDSQPLPACP